MTIENEIFDKLSDVTSDMYRKLGHDVALSINWCLTEPVCPFVCLVNDDTGERMDGFGCWGDTVPGGVNSLIAQIQRWRDQQDQSSEG